MSALDVVGATVVVIVVFAIFGGSYWWLWVKSSFGLSVKVIASALLIAALFPTMIVLLVAEAFRHVRRDARIAAV